MTYISLKEVIDDILLIVRNNNISESEDLSRAQISAWVKHYKHALWKEKLDRLKEKLQNGADIEDLIDDEYIKVKETGPMELENVESRGGKDIHTRKTIDKLENVFNNDERSILAIHDEEGCNIQYMNHIRRHYHNFRKYTSAELTAYYEEDGHVYIQGWQDDNILKYIWVLAVYEEPEDDIDEDDDGGPSEDDIKIPAWMIPVIKNNIMKNELSFMLNRPSDDSNNATLASVKPHGPQDNEE